MDSPHRNSVDIDTLTTLIENGKGCQLAKQLQGMGYEEQLNILEAVKVKNLEKYQGSYPQLDLAHQFRRPYEANYPEGIELFISVYNPKLAPSDRAEYYYSFSPNDNQKETRCVDRELRK